MQNKTNFIQNSEGFFSLYLEMESINKLSKALEPASKLSKQLEQIHNTFTDTQLQRFSVAIEQAIQRQPYKEKAFNQLKDQIFEFSLQLNYRDLLECIDLCVDSAQSIEEFSILSVVKEKCFAEMVLNRFNQLDFENKSKRALVIEEIFYLIRIDRYAGAINLLYGQFEGLLTDFLISQGLLRLIKNQRLQYEGRKFDHQYPDGRSKSFSSHKNITGLTDKILIARHYFEEFDQLFIYRVNESGNSYADSRNAILHGSDLNNFTLDRAYILAMWFYLVCNWMEKVGRGTA